MNLMVYMLVSPLIYIFLVIGFIITFVIPATSKIYLVNSCHEQITSLIA